MSLEFVATHVPCEECVPDNYALIVAGNKTFRASDIPDLFDRADYDSHVELYERSRYLFERSHHNPGVDADCLFTTGHATLWRLNIDASDFYDPDRKQTPIDIQPSLADGDGFR